MKSEDDETPAVSIASAGRRRLLQNAGSAALAATAFSSPQIRSAGLVPSFGAAASSASGECVPCLPLTVTSTSATFDYPDAVVSVARAVRISLPPRLDLATTIDCATRTLSMELLSFVELTSDVLVAKVKVTLSDGTELTMDPYDLGDGGSIVSVLPERECSSIGSTGSNPVPLVVSGVFETYPVPGLLPSSVVTFTASQLDVLDCCNCCS